MYQPIIKFDVAGDGVGDGDGEGGKAVIGGYLLRVIRFAVIDRAGGFVFDIENLIGGVGDGGEVDVGGIYNF